MPDQFTGEQESADEASQRGRWQTMKTMFSRTDGPSRTGKAVGPRAGWVAIEPEWPMPHHKDLAPELTAGLLYSAAYEQALTGLTENYKQQEIRTNPPVSPEG